MNPAEPAERAALASAALADRAEELRKGELPGAPGGEPLPPPRDVARDKAALAAVVECAAQGGARLLAARFPHAALLAGTVCDKAQSFAAECGERFGQAAGERFPRALPAAGGVAGMLVWWLRTLPRPKPPELAPPPAPGAPVVPGQAQPSPEDFS